MNITLNDNRNEIHVKICCCQQQEPAAYGNSDDGNSRLSSAQAARPILIKTPATLSALVRYTESSRTVAF